MKRKEIYKLNKDKKIVYNCKTTARLLAENIKYEVEIVIKY